MPRVQPKTISKEDKRQLLNEFWDLVELARTRRDIENFFRDLLSETEAVMLARRVRIAKMLLDERTYDDIRKTMNTSYVTIASVHRWLQGRNEGYMAILSRSKQGKRKK